MHQRLGWYLPALLLISLTGGSGCQKAVDLNATITWVLKSPVVDLPAHGHVHQKDLPQIITVPADGWIIEIAPQVYNASSRVLHHVFVKQNGVFPFGTGRELTAIRFPEGFGVPVRKGDTLSLAELHLDNPDSIRYPQTQAGYSLTFLPKSSGVPIRPLTHLALTVTHPTAVGLYNIVHTRTTTYWPEPGHSVKTSEKPISVKTPFRAVVLQGHIHDYAQELQLRRNGGSAWTCQPVRDAEGHIVSIPIRIDLNGIPFAAGDQVDLAVTHNNPHEKPVDMMGMVVMWVAMESEGEPFVQTP